MSSPGTGRDFESSLFQGLELPDDTIDTSKPEAVEYDHNGGVINPHRDRRLYDPHEHEPNTNTAGLIDFSKHVEVEDADIDSLLGDGQHTAAYEDSDGAAIAGELGVENLDLGAFDPIEDRPASAGSRPATGSSGLDFDLGPIELEETIDEAETSYTKRRRLFIALGSIATVIVLVLGVTALVSAFSAPDVTDLDIDTEFIATPTYVDTSQTTATLDVSGTPVWEIPADEAGVLSVYRAGILQVHDGKANLLSTATGEVIADRSLEEPIDVTFETVDADSKPAVGYQTESEIVIMSVSSVDAWELPSDDLHVVATGDVALLTDKHSRKAYVAVAGEDDLVEANYDVNLMLSGADEGHLLQPISNTPRVELVSYDGTDSKVVELVPGNERMSFVRHLSIGHGLSLALWELEGVKLASTHDLTTGKSVATVPVEEASGWTVGRGGQLAVMGRYVVDMSTGHFIYEADRTLDGAVNTIPYIEESSGRTLIIDDQSVKQSQRLRGVTESVMVMENGDSSISVYPNIGSPIMQTHGGGLA